jgi:hypothetical protein
MLHRKDSRCLSRKRYYGPTSLHCSRASQHDQCTSH